MPRTHSAGAGTARCTTRSWWESRRGGCANATIPAQRPTSLGRRPSQTLPCWAAPSNLRGQVFVGAVPGAQVCNLRGVRILAQQHAPGGGVAHAALRVAVARLLQQGSQAGGQVTRVMGGDRPGGRLASAHTVRGQDPRKRLAGGRPWTCSPCCTTKAHLECLQRRHGAVPKAPPPLVVLCSHAGSASGARVTPTQHRQRRGGMSTRRKAK